MDSDKINVHLKEGSIVSYTHYNDKYNSTGSILATDNATYIILRNKDKYAKSDYIY